jgi:hypothetical protein
MDFVEQTIIDRDQRHTEQEKADLINVRLDFFYNELWEQQKQCTKKVTNAISQGRSNKNNTREMAKATALGDDKLEIRVSQVTFKKLLAQGDTVENATHEIQNFIGNQLDTERPAIQILRGIFSVPSLPDNNR